MNGIVTDDLGFKYSKEEFEGYKHRVMVRFSIKREFDPYGYAIVNYYTTNTDKESVRAFIEGRVNKEKVTSFNIEYFPTKEQDQMDSELIDEL